MKIIVVDDEKNMRDSIRKYMQLENIEVVCAENGLSAKRLLEAQVFSAGIVDLRMPGMDGIELLQWIMDSGPRLPVVMISAHGEIQDAVEAMKFGAKDYIVKPFDPQELVMRLKRILQDAKMRSEVEAGKRTSVGPSEMIGDGESMKAINRVVAKIAATPSTVLITGESGTGKAMNTKFGWIFANSPLH